MVGDAFDALWKCGWPYKGSLSGEDRIYFVGIGDTFFFPGWFARACVLFDHKRPLFCSSLSSLSGLLHLPKLRWFCTLLASSIYLPSGCYLLIYNIHLIFNHLISIRVLFIAQFELPIFSSLKQELQFLGVSGRKNYSKVKCLIIQGGFFHWYPPKSSKCQPVSKFWHLELFWLDLLCNPTLRTFWGGTSQKNHPVYALYIGTRNILILMSTSALLSWCR